MRKACGGEDGNLLVAHDEVHVVDYGDAGLDYDLRVVSGGGVDGYAVDVKVGLGQNLRRGLGDLVRPIEGSLGIVVNSHLVCRLSMLEVPLNTWTTARKRASDIQ